MLWSDVHKYYVYSVLNNLLFFIPIVFIYFRAIGLTYTEIFLCETIFSIGVAVFEVPTGAVADRFGKKVSIILGGIAAIIANFLCIIASGFWLIAFSQIILALGVALTSGADTALLYTILINEKKEREFKKYQGTAKSLSLISISLASFIGGFVATVSMPLTFLLSIFAFILFILIISTVQEKSVVPVDQPLQWNDIISKSWRLITKTKLILWLTVFSTLIVVSFRLLMPVTQTYLEYTGLPLRYFGFASAYFFLIAAVAAKTVHTFERVFQRYAHLVLALLFTVPLVGLIYIQTTWSFLLFGFIYFATSITTITVDHELLKVAPHHYHATILSFNSLCARILFVLIAPLFGYAIEFWGLFNAMLLLASILVLVFLPLLSFRSRYP